MLLREWKASGKAGARSNREMRRDTGVASSSGPAPGDTSGGVGSGPPPTPDEDEEPVGTRQVKEGVKDGIKEEDKEGVMKEVKEGVKRGEEGRKGGDKEGGREERNEGGVIKENYRRTLRYTILKGKLRTFVHRK